jgi:hypothetical protein
MTLSLCSALKELPDLLGQPATLMTFGLVK